MQGRVCAIVYVRESLLVGVLGFEPGDDEKKDEGKDDSEDVETPTTGTGESSSGSVSREESYVDGRFDGAGEEDEGKEKMSRALLIKAEALAEHLREELSEFKMPKDFLKDASS